jgi:hypothetical protein
LDFEFRITDTDDWLSPRAMGTIWLGEFYVNRNDRKKPEQKYGLTLLPEKITELRI